MHSLFMSLSLLWLVQTEPLKLHVKNSCPTFKAAEGVAGALKNWGQKHAKDEMLRQGCVRGKFEAASGTDFVVFSFEDGTLIAIVPLADGRFGVMVIDDLIRSNVESAGEEV